MNGLARIEHAASVTGTIRHLPAMAAVVLYHLFGEFAYGLGEPNNERVMQLINDWVANNEHGPISDIGLGYACALKGDLPGCHKWLDTFMSHPDIPKKVHFAILWLQGLFFL